MDKKKFKIAEKINREIWELESELETIQGIMNEPNVKYSLELKAIKNGIKRL